MGEYLWPRHTPEELEALSSLVEYMAAEIESRGCNKKITLAALIALMGMMMKDQTLKEKKRVCQDMYRVLLYTQTGEWETPPDRVVSEETLFKERGKIKITPIYFSTSSWNEDNLLDIDSKAQEVVDMFDYTTEEGHCLGVSAITSALGFFLNRVKPEPQKEFWEAVRRSLVKVMDMGNDE